MDKIPALCCPPVPRNPRSGHVRPSAGADKTLDYEVITLCTEDGAQVLLQYNVSVAPPVIVAMVDLSTGAAWTGDVTTLQPCGSNAESDPVLMCDNGVQFLRHIVKKDGEPTGVKFDTKLDGTIYTVTDEASVTYGECKAACTPDISSATADDLSGLRPGHSISIQKDACCKLNVSTSAGDFMVAKNVTGYAIGGFECPVSVTGVDVLEGTCALADIIVTVQKLK